MCYMHDGLTFLFQMQPTFQLVVASDGRSTFAIYLYDDLVALTGDHVSRTVDVVFSKPDDPRYTFLRPATLHRISIFRVDGMC